MSVADLAQSAICPASHAHGLYMAFDRPATVGSAAARQALAALAAVLDDWRQLDHGARSCWAIGIGANDWNALVGHARPALLAGFPAFDDAVHPVPDTPHALFLHLRSERQDLCFAAGETARHALAGMFVLAEATPGFRYLDSRDLTGFVDGTENPTLDERPDVALVDDDGDFNGGSYLHVQRFVHDLPKWHQLPVATQEHIVGRSKQDDVELDDAEKPASAHIARVVIEEDGEELAIVRQSLPYGAVGGEQGLMFISYCKTPDTFTQMLMRMVTEREGPADNLLRFTRAVSGGAYFVPPRAMLASWSA
jgi:putative iron-dependent peroxidase